jgi:hypothetical protein
VNLDEPLLLSMEEAQKRLGISLYLLKCETYSGRLRSARIRGRRMIPLCALNEYIELVLAEEDEHREAMMVHPRGELL